MDKELIKKAQQAYDKGDPIMSDEAFDTLTNDESQFKLTEDTYTILHSHEMGSMPKVHNNEDLEKLLEDEMFVQPKFDGISCEIQLENGVIKSISTRGEGKYGKDLSNLLEAGFLSSDTVINFSPELTSIYGEITLNSKEPSQKDRNIVSGICNKDKPTKEEVSSLVLNVYKAYRSNDVIVPYLELESMYISNSTAIIPSVTYVITRSGKSLDQKIEEFKQLFDIFYPNTKRDGIVFKRSSGFLMEIEDKEFALKPEPLSAVTTITDVSWTKGKSKFSATAIIDPVTLGGVTIGRVTLPDKYIREMDLHIGDIIEITRAGDVIPKIVRLVEKGEDRKEIIPPNVCEFGHEIKQIGKSLVCTEDNCQSFAKDYLNHVCDIMFWGIKRPPRSKLHKLIDTGIVTLSNILNLELYKDSVTEREYYLINDGINNFLSQELNVKLLLAFNIDGLSLSKARKYITSDGDLIDLIKDSEDIYLYAINYAYNHSKEIREFISNTLVK